MVFQLTYNCSGDFLRLSWFVLTSGLAQHQPVRTVSKRTFFFVRVFDCQVSCDVVLNILWVIVVLFLLFFRTALLFSELTS